MDSLPGSATGVEGQGKLPPVACCMSRVRRRPWWPQDDLWVLLKVAPAAHIPVSTCVAACEILRGDVGGERAACPARR